jgi:hypothetical protein
VVWAVWLECALVLSRRLAILSNKNMGKEASKAMEVTRIPQEEICLLVLEF